MSKLEAGTVLRVLELLMGKQDLGTFHKVTALDDVQNYERMNFVQALRFPPGML